jgi:excisionase family DNA binding protein
VLRDPPTKVASYDMENQPLTLTVEQAAKVLGIGRSTAYELVHTGAIPSLRLGRRIVVPVARLAALLGMPAPNVAHAEDVSGPADHRPVAPMSRISTDESLSSLAETRATSVRHSHDLESQVRRPMGLT